MDAAKLIINECWIKAKTLKSYGTHWEYMKYKIRRLAIQRGKDIAQAKRIKEDFITKEIIKMYGKEIRILRFRPNLRAFVRSRRNCLEEGEKHPKYFFNLQKKKCRSFLFE